MFNLIDLLFALKHLLPKLFLYIHSYIQLRLEHHDLILKLTIFSLHKVLLGLLTLQFRLQLTYLCLHEPLLLVSLHYHLLMKLGLRVHLVNLLSSPLNLVLQAHVLIPDPLYLKLPVLHLLLHVLDLSVHIPVPSFPPDHVHVKLQLLNLCLQLNLSLPTPLCLLLEHLVLTLQLFELVHACLERLIVELLVPLVLLLLPLVLVLHLEEPLIHQVIVLSHRDHLPPHLICVASLIRCWWVEVYQLRVKRGRSLRGCRVVIEGALLFKVLLPGLLRGGRVKPLDTSSVVWVLVRVLAVWVVQQNFVLVRDTWGHVAYFTYDLLTISDKLSLIVPR